MKVFCRELEEQMPKAKGFEAVNKLAFEAHYQLVSIHPFLDRNGRTSRLCKTTYSSTEENRLHLY
ncbi:MAG: Fic family protein [Flavobacteriaceae bacterium]